MPFNSEFPATFDASKRRLLEERWGGSDASGETVRRYLSTAGVAALGELSTQRLFRHIIGARVMSTLNASNIEIAEMSYRGTQLYAAADCTAYDRTQLPISPLTKQRLLDVNPRQLLSDFDEQAAGFYEFVIANRGPLGMADRDLGNALFMGAGVAHFAATETTLQTSMEQLMESLHEESS